MEKKQCNMCGEFLPNTEEFFSPRYYVIQSGERKKSLLSRCRACYRDYHKKNHTEKIQNGDIWLTSCELVNRMKDRTRKYGYSDPVEWDAKAVYNRIISGNCEATGHPFRYGTPKKGSKHKNPFAPSPDRIDNTKGYTKDNTRFVVFMYNTMRNNFEDDDVSAFLDTIKKEISLNGSY